MKRKNIAWLVVTCLMVAALLLASCAPAVVEEKKVTPPVGKEEVAPPVKEKEVVVPGKEVVPEGFVKWTGVKLDGTVVEKMMEKPRYGGVLVMTTIATNVYFDGGPYTPPAQGRQTGERVISADWTRGAAGTGELFFGPYDAPSLETIGNSVAESLEIIDPNTMVIHLRKGVRFHDKPPTNGREFVADDILYNFERGWQFPQSYPSTNVPKATFIESITAPDDYTVVIKVKQPGQLAEIYEVMLGYVNLVPREAVEKYGDLNDWRNDVGLGPYLLVDYVSASSLTYVRNPNYWQHDPFFPENRLPYPDGVKTLFITDISTRNAALRTGKIDVVTGSSGADAVTWQDWEMFMKTNPELKYRGTLGRPPSIRMRVDTKPFDDIRVRQALMLAIDNQAIKDYYYGGHAEIISWPAAPIPDQAGWYTPLEELPENVRELFSYNPDKARRLLAEAGYPGGFQTEILTKPEWVDNNVLIKGYWAKIGVDLKLDVKEAAVYTSLGNKRLHKAMYAYEVGYNRPWTFQFVAAGMIRNYGMVDDPVIQEAYHKIVAAYFDDPLRQRLMKEIVPYILEQAYIVLPPAPYVYTVWWPWLKGYSGEDSVGFMQQQKFTTYVWIDQALKKAMGR